MDIFLPYKANNSKVQLKLFKTGEENHKIGVANS